MLHFAGPGLLERPPGRSGFRSMHWFRRRQSSATGAALFALLLQLALSFGHVHGGLADHSPAFSIAHSQNGDGAALPAQDGDGHSPDGLCAICATVHLLGTSQIAGSPALPTRDASAAAPAPLSRFAAPPEQRHTAFRSRAPPLT